MERDKVNCPRKKRGMKLITTTIVVASKLHYVSNILLYHFVYMCIGNYFVLVVISIKVWSCHTSRSLTPGIRSDVELDFLNSLI